MYDIVIKDANTYKKYHLKFLIEYFINEYNKIYKSRIDKKIDSYTETRNLFENLFNNKNWLYLIKKYKNKYYYIFFDVHLETPIDFRYEFDEDILFKNMFDIDVNKEENTEKTYFKNCNIHIVEKEFFDKKIKNHYFNQIEADMGWHLAKNYILKTKNIDNPSEYYKSLLLIDTIIEI